MSEEESTGIIATRIYPSSKRQLRDEAIERRQTLSEYIHELIELVWEQIKR